MSNSESLIESIRGDLDKAREILALTAGHPNAIEPGSGPGDREALVDALVEDAWEGHAEPLDRAQLGLIADAVLAAGFSRPVEPDPIQGGVIEVSPGQGIAVGDALIRDAREREIRLWFKNWPSLGRVSPAFESALGSLELAIDDLLSRPVGGETVTEWEYGAAHVDDLAAATPEASKRAAEMRAWHWNLGTRTRSGVVVRRRKAGPWAPVPPERDWASAMREREERRMRFFRDPLGVVGDEPGGAA